MGCSWEHTVHRGLTRELLEHLGSTGEPVTRLADRDVQDELLDAELPHGVLGLLRLSIVLVRPSAHLYCGMSRTMAAVLSIIGAGRVVDDPGIWESEVDFRSTNLRLCVWGLPRACRVSKLGGGQGVWRQAGVGAVADPQFPWLSRRPSSFSLAFKFRGRLVLAASTATISTTPSASLRSLHQRPRRDRTRRSRSTLSTQNPIFASLKTLLCSILLPRCRRQTSKARW